MKALKICIFENLNTKIIASTDKKEQSLLRKTIQEEERAINFGFGLVKYACWKD